jgi:pyruvate dehydrogenase E2 component (dihydrolipoamide acetyltransferase)
MSEIREIKVPDIGDFDAVDVVEVLVAAGDRVAKDDSLITLESDKATMDVPSPVTGTVRELKVKAGDKVHEGTAILTIEPQEEEGEEKEKEAGGSPRPSAEADRRDGEETDAGQDDRAGISRGGDGSAGTDAGPGERRESSGERAAASQKAPASAAGLPEAAQAPERHPVEVVQEDFSRVYASPAVRYYARQLGVDLTRVRGTGRNGRILTEDVQGWVKETLASPTAGAGRALAVPEIPAIDYSKFGEIEKVSLTRVQKISGPNLQRSWLSAPHVTQHDEADITELETFRQQHKEQAKADGYSLTPLAFIIKAVVSALETYPRVNSSLDPDGEHLILKRYYHFGIAVDTEEGLMVPVIRDVDRKGIIELARELADVSQQARDRKLTPDRLRGASFTISSLGGIGGSFFTPIVNTPEVAILGVGRHRRAPQWNGKEFEPRLMLPLSLSYDHRVIDGALAVRFTTYLASVLGDIRRLLL